MKGRKDIRMKAAAVIHMLSLGTSKLDHTIGGDIVAPRGSSWGGGGELAVVYMYICLYVYMFICYMSICLYVYLFICL